MGYRINDLQPASVPMSGSELVEIEQNGGSRKVAVSDLLPGFDGDALRGTLADASSPQNGAAVIGRSTVSVVSIVDLLNAKRDASQTIVVRGYRSGTRIGGGKFDYDPTRPKNQHDGGTVISPTVPWDGQQTTLSAFLLGTGETDPSGSGCFVRRYETVTPFMYGTAGDGVVNDLAAIKQMVSKIGVYFLEVNFMRKQFYCGAITDAMNETGLCTITNVDNLAIYGMPRFLVDNQLTNSPNHQYVSGFQLIDCNDPYVECSITGSVFDKNNPRGPVAVNFKNVAKSVRGGRVIAKCRNGLAAFQTRRVKGATEKRTPEDPTWKGITYQCDATDTEYGVRLLASGDDCQGTVNSLRVGRSFFAVGVNDQIATINSEAPQLISDVLVKAYADNVDNIHVTLNQRNADGAAWPATIEHQNDTDDTSITNVHIHLNVTGRVNPRVFSNGETTREYVRVGSVFDLAGNIKAATNCVTDNIFITGAPKSMGVVSGVRDSILNLPTATNKPGRISIDFVDNLRSTKGFTIVKGDTLRGKASGSLASNPVKIDLRNCWPAGGVYRVDTHVNANFADTDMGNSLTRGDILYIGMDINGAGSVVSSIALYSGSRGTAPTVSYSVANGQLVATGAGSTAANAEINVVVQPLSGRFI